MSSEAALHATRVTADQLIAAVCREYRLAERSLLAGGQGRRVSEVRAAIAWLATELGCTTLAELGHRMRREKSSLSSAVRW